MAVVLVGAGGLGLLGGAAMFMSPSSETAAIGFGIGLLLGGLGLVGIVLGGALFVFVRAYRLP